MNNPLWSLGDVDGGVTLTDNDHVYPAHISELRTARDNSGIYNIKDYGAKGDGATDDTAAIQSVIDTLGPTGGTILFPAGNFICASTLTVAAAQRGVNFVGLGGKSSGATTETMLTYTGAGTSFISARNTSAFSIENIYILYNNASFTGILIDVRGGNGGPDAAYGVIRDCHLVKSGSGGSAAALIALSKNIIMKIENCMLSGGDVQILGRDDSTTDYCNGLEIDHCTFRNAAVAAIKNAGEAWSINNCIFETIAGGKAGAYTHDAGVKGLGVTFDGCWFGDVTAAAGGDQITWSGDGLNIRGCTLSANTGSDLVVFDENGCEGIMINGNVLGYADVAINFGATTGHYDVNIQNNAYRNVTTEMNNPPHLWSIMKADGTRPAYIDKNGLLWQVRDATDGVLASTVLGDASSRFSRRTDGKMTWGNGTDAGDTFLARSAPKVFLVNNEVKIATGAGSPENVVTAPVGSLYLRTDGGANTTLYIKETGATNTGWQAM